MLGTGQYFFGVSNPLYTDDQAKLATALAAAVKGNGAPLLASSDDYIGRRPNGTYSTETSANTAINCADGRGINGVRAALALQGRFVADASVVRTFHGLQQLGLRRLAGAATAAAAADHRGGRSADCRDRQHRGPGHPLRRSGPPRA